MNNILLKNCEPPLPSNYDAEKKIVGMMLRDKEACFHLLEQIEDEDFYHTATKTLFKTIRELTIEKIQIDSITLNEALQKSNRLQAVQGIGFIHDVVDSVIQGMNYDHYLDILKEKSKLRRISRLCYESLIHIENNSKTPETIQDELHQETIKNYKNNKGAVPIGTNPDEYIQFMEDRYERKRNKKHEFDGPKCGIADLDRPLNGWQPGLYIIASRPSVGKTSIGLQILDGLSKYGLSILYPFEGGGRRKLLERYISRRTRLNLTDELDKQQVSRLMHEVYDSENSNLYINDSMPTQAQIEAEAYRLSLENKIAAIGIDYIGIMNNKGIPGEKKYEWVPEITRRNSHLSNTLNCPIIALQQLSRDSDKSDREPRLSDLRDSGAVEQDADVVIFLHRQPKKQEEGSNEEMDNSGPITVIIAKNRNGPLAKFELYFDASTFFFGDQYQGKDDSEVPF